MIEREFIGLESPAVGRMGAGGYPCQGNYYRPAGTEPTTAMIATHYNVDFSEHYIASYMADRGYGFLGWNTRFRGNEAYFQLDHALAEIAVGVRWLRERGVEKVVLLGNSGGGSLMSAYYSQAVKPNIRPAYGRHHVYPPAMELPVTDLIIYLAAHTGRPEWITSSMDPSVVDETDPTTVYPALDMYNPDNGPPYAPDFVQGYRAAQVARNHRISDWCKEELTRLNAAEVPDRLFVIPRTWADLRYVDASLDPSDRPTPLCYFGDPSKANRGIFGVGTVCTLRTWLNMFSLEDSDCMAGKHLPNVDVPALVITAEGDTGVFPSDAQFLFDNVAAPDKKMVALPGDHYFVEPPSARDAVADVMADWLSAHDA